MTAATLAQLITDLPPLSAWLFYAANVILVAAYLAIVALIMRPSGFTGRGQMSPTITTLCVLFFLTCALLHVELAVNAWQRNALIQAETGGTGVDIHFTLVVVAKVVIVAAGLIYSRRAPAPPARPAGAPLEIGAAHIHHAVIDDAQLDPQLAAQLAAQATEPAPEVRSRPGADT